MRVVTFKVDESLLEKLDLYAMSNNLTRSEVIREAIEAYVNGRIKPKVIRIRRVVLI